MRKRQHEMMVTAWAKGLEEKVLDVTPVVSVSGVACMETVRNLK